VRYWFFDETRKTATGPHLDLVLAHQPGFGPESRVAPAGPEPARDWMRAKDIPELKRYLAPEPPPPSPEKPK
jgi:hypothetical protein